MTGDDLVAFINNDEALRPDGKRGPGLFAYLKNLAGETGGDRRDVVANVFRGTLNRMVSGYILREVLQGINAINFTASEEIHTLSALYESMLKEMRDAAGDAGEFYTPRAVVRFMVAALNPRLGETLLDPACGTGGFRSNPSSTSAKSAIPSKSWSACSAAPFLASKPNPSPTCCAR